MGMPPPIMESIYNNLLVGAGNPLGVMYQDPRLNQAVTEQYKPQTNYKRETGQDGKPKPFGRAEMHVAIAHYIQTSRKSEAARVNQRG